MTDPILTRDTLLGGRVLYAQPTDGLRSGIEPILLAAAIPARPSQRVLEAGSGSGAGLLCLAERVAGIVGVGVELDPALARIAAANATANGRGDLRFVAGDLRDAALEGIFDHAFANPPYHAATGTRSPSAANERAKRGDTGLLAVWAAAMGRILRHRGTLTFILPAALLHDGLAAFATAGCPGATVFPLWKRQGQPAKLMLLQGVKGGRTPLRLAAGLVLHGGGQAYTPMAEDILRNGRGLTLA